MDRKIFYNAIRLTLFDGSLNTNQVAGIENLLNVWEKYFNGPLDELAINLATAMHETGGTMQPIMERGSRSYFDKYEPGTRLGKMLGNTVRGDGFRFRGAGHVQNTGRRNAIVATKRLNELFKLGIDLVANPEQRLDPFVSAMSLFLGNREGWWTGKKLSDYLDGEDESDKEDLAEFVKSRYVVNGTDKATEIGKKALKYETALKLAGYPYSGKPSATVQPPLRPSEPAKPAEPVKPAPTPNAPVSRPPVLDAYPPETKKPAKSWIDWLSGIFRK